MNSFTLSSNRLQTRNAASLPKTRPAVSRLGIRSFFTLALALLAFAGTAEVANAQCDPGLARNCCQNAPGTDCTTNADCGGSLCQPCLYSNGDPFCELASSNPACSLDPASPCVTDAECNFGTCEVEACTVNSDCVAGATCNTGTCSQNSCSGNGVVGCVNNADCVDTCEIGDCASCPSAGCECTSGSNCYYAFTCCKFNDQTVGTSTPCADGNACTLDGVCDANGNCNAGGLFEPQGSPCGDPSSTPCDLPDSCDAAGTCLTNEIPENDPCDDGVYCNGSDTCDAVGGCSNHAGDPCLGGSECNVVCNEGSQNCFDPAATPCGSAADTTCTNPDTCDGSGTCLSNDEVITTPCDDGLFCTVTDECDGAGTCAGTGDPCAGGAVCQTICNEAADNCFDPAATPCDDGLFCTDVDQCDGSGTCAGTGDPCAGGAQCQQVCNETADNCFDAAATPCNDGLFCTVTDACDGSGTCAGTGDPCAGGAVCQQICNEGADNCNDPAATPCDDGLFCTQTDACDGSGSCAGSGDPCAGGAECNQDCNESADNCFDPAPTACGSAADTDCTNPDTCDGSGTCLSNDEVATTSCDDGLFCTQTDECDGSGTCAGTGDPCAANGECNQVCNEGADNCFDAAATPCGSSSVTDCDLADTCDGSGTCDTNYVAAATACGDSSDTDCTNPDTCDGSGTCDPNNEPAATVCDDGLFCTQTDECDGSGTCAGTGDPCSGGGTCNQVCDDTNDDCFDPAGTPCLDSNFCNGPEACDGSGVCAPGTPPSCDDLNECTADSCDPATSCVHVATGYATLCNFGILVSSNDDELPAKLTTGKAPTVNSEVCADGANIGPFTSLVSAPGALPVPVEANIITTRPARFGEFSVKAKAGATTDANVYTDATKVKCQKSSGCFNTPGTKVIDTGLIVPITGGGDIDTTGADPANKILICENVQSLMAADTADLNARADAGSPTDLGKIKVNKGQTYTINATTVGGESFYDAFKVQLGRGAIINFDGGGDPNSVMVLRVDKKVEFGRSTQVNLVNGASLENVLIMAPTAGKCSVGREATGSGQLFCPAAKVQVGRDANWTGTIVAGNKSKIGRDATVVSGRFTGIIP